VAGGVDGHDAVRVDGAFALQQPREGASDVAVADQCEFQKLSFSTNLGQLAFEGGLLLAGLVQAGLVID